MPKQMRPLRATAQAPVPVWKKELEKQWDSMPKTLIAISSCQLYEDKGWHDAARQTWLTEAKALGFDYKFFLGEELKKKTTLLS